MKKILLGLLIAATTLCTHADITVKSFRKLENDMTARVNASKKDKNGDVCALIKVVTTQTGFIWEPDQLGIVSAENTGGEYWIYLPYSAKRITIKHPLLGVLRDYMYPMPIEKATVYEMVLTTNNVDPGPNLIESQWLVITPEPANALVYINDEFVKTGEYMAKLKAGSYNYRVELPLYHTEAGVIEMGSEKKTLNATLKPAFGYLKISSQPESGAKVFVNGKLLPATTPLTTDAIASGQHTVQVVKEMYKPINQTITITDGQTTPLNVVLQPNFAELTITAPAGADIVLNNQQKGTGTWSGRLSAGVYSMEARLAKHRTAKQDIELSTGEQRTINLQPAPIYGSLDVLSSPSGATISIDGKNQGTTPATINHLLIGDYAVHLNRTGYITVTKTISITEGTTAMINEKLTNGREITIRSTPAGANLFIDNQKVGTTPYTGNLTFGTHKLQIEHNGKQAEKTVSIAQNGGSTIFELSFGPANFTETIKGVNFDMMAVKGGTFKMGSNEGDSDEKPVHTVTVSDFYMGKTAVTQELWQTVMGNNPSYFKGNNRPVESVSWNDCQEFITKLNQLTGKKYRLPTEAEWEYAAGGGASNRTKWAGTNNEANLDTYAWYTTNSSNKTHEVGIKQTNSLGLFDMSGNVWEWCNDWYGNYSSSPQTNPTGPSDGSLRVGRGGSGGSSARGCRVAGRASYAPDLRGHDLGFRLVFCP